MSDEDVLKSSGRRFWVLTMRQLAAEHAIACDRRDVAEAALVAIVRAHPSRPGVYRHKTIREARKLVALIEARAK